MGPTKRGCSCLFCETTPVFWRKKERELGRLGEFEHVDLELSDDAGELDSLERELTEERAVVEDFSPENWSLKLASKFR